MLQLVILLMLFAFTAANHDQHHPLKPIMKKPEHNHTHTKHVQYKELPCFPPQREDLDPNIGKGKPCEKDTECWELYPTLGYEKFSYSLKDHAKHYVDEEHQEYCHCIDKYCGIAEIRSFKIKRTGERRHLPPRFFPCVDEDPQKNICKRDYD